MTVFESFREVITSKVADEFVDSSALQKKDSCMIFVYIGLKRAKGSGLSPLQPPSPDLAKCITKNTFMHTSSMLNTFKEYTPKECYLIYVW